MGKSFFSPPGGLYLSLVKQTDFAQPAQVTALAAVATAKAIENVVGKTMSIKWVNDLFFKEKKVCGILCENISEGFSPSFRAIIGIGINMIEPEKGFPKELENRAGALFSTPPQGDIKSLLCAEIINQIYIFSNKRQEEIFEDYKKRLFMLGQEVIVTQNGRSFEAKAISIDKNFYLTAELCSGERKKLCSGEVSLKTE